MSAKSQRPTERGTAADQRRTADRRAAARDGEGRTRGRRATDIGDARPGGAGSAGISGRKRRSTSDGREPLVVYLRPEAIKALKIAALEHDSTASAIVAQSVDTWLRAHGRPPRRQG